MTRNALAPYLDVVVYCGPEYQFNCTYSMLMFGLCSICNGLWSCSEYVYYFFKNINYQTITTYIYIEQMLIVIGYQVLILVSIVHQITHPTHPTTFVLIMIRFLRQYQHPTQHFMKMLI